MMRRSQLKNKVNKTKDLLIYQLYRKQRNYVVNLNKKEKRLRFSATKTNDKSFWHLAKPHFSNKGCTNDEKIFLLEDDSIVNEDLAVANIFNDHFVNITSGLSIVHGIHRIPLLLP